MANINIKITNDSIVFKIMGERRKNPNVNLTRTNIINTDSMVFTEKYILNNIDIVSSFIYGITMQKKITKIVIANTEIIPVVFYVTRKIKTLNMLYLTEDEPISHDTFERLYNYPNLIYINCYNMKSYMLEKLDRNNLAIELRCEILYVSNFMNTNDLNSFSSLYYKKNICFKEKLNQNDINEFDSFIKVNKYLKVIDLYYYTRETLRILLNVLVKNNKKNIRIDIHQTDENIETINNTIEYLKELQSILQQKINLNFKIVYSDEYKKENFPIQFAINVIKFGCMIAIFTIFSGLAVTEYNSYKSEKNKDYLNNLVENAFISDPVSSSSSSNVISSTDIISSDIISSNLDQPSSSSLKKENIQYEEAFDKLISINQETVAYIKVNNTEIIYPVVQATDNKYYLTHDFYKKSNMFGWVFMDYRNNNQDLDQNTIIYGHNSRKKTMFGTLKKALEEKWYTNPTNQIITFNTPKENMNFKIFSIYKIDVTSDYLYTNFDDDKEYYNFLKMLTDRSIYNFNTEVNIDDKIITLSTCIDNSTRRIVVHAKLI